MKRLLWILPLLAIVCGALSSYAFYRSTTGLLQSLQTIDSPALTGAQALIFDLNNFADSVKSAVAAADKGALEGAVQRANAFRANLHQYGEVPGKADEAARLGQQFDTYFNAAMNVAAILLDGKAGDVGEAAQTMQAALAAVDAQLKQQKDAAQGGLADHIQDTRSLATKGFVVSVAASMLTLLLSSGASLVAIRGLLRQLGGTPDEALSIVHRIASGDLSQPVAWRDGSQGSLLHAMHRMQEKLVQVLGDVHFAVAKVRDAADDIQHGNRALTERSRRQAANIQSSAASVDELTASVRLNAESAEHARDLAQEACTHADEGSHAVGHAVGTMGEISERARKIVDITALIDGIAFQTNILALNAAVEAARAGSQGRGFNVVAGEVRILAQRAAAASKEIKTLIEDSAQRIEVGSRHVNAAGLAMAELVASVRRVGEYITNISTASGEQRVGIELVNHAVSDLDASTQENLAMVEQAGQAAAALQGVSRQLGEAVGQFRLADLTLDQLTQAPAPPGAPAAPLLLPA